MFTPSLQLGHILPKQATTNHYLLMSALVSFEHCIT